MDITSYIYDEFCCYVDQLLDYLYLHSGDIFKFFAFVVMYIVAWIFLPQIQLLSRPSKKLTPTSDDGAPGDHCVSCSFITNHLHPHSTIHSFMVYFCEFREDAFYELCSAFGIPQNVCANIENSNSSLKLQCFDALHQVYHRDNELTLDTIKTKLSEYSDELEQIVCDYHVDK